MRGWTCVAFALITAVSGAGADAADRRKKKKDAEEQIACAVNVNGLKATPLLDLHQKYKGRYKLERKYGCLGDESGRVLPAVLLSLPAYAEPYAVRVAAMTKPSEYIVMRISLLDESFVVTRQVPSEEIKRRGTEWSTDVFINPENAGERYVLVHADPEAVGMKDFRVALSMSQVVFPVAPTGAVGSWMSGNDRTVEMTAVDSGQLMLTLVGEQWEDKKKKK